MLPAALRAPTRYFIKPPIRFYACSLPTGGSQLLALARFGDFDARKLALSLSVE
jgi:hypothetical protein